MNPKCEIYDIKDTICNSYDDGNCPFTGTIYGYKGSTAEAYAKKYDRKFVALESAPTTPADPAPQVEAYSTGDVTGYAAINAKDANAVLIAAAKIGAGSASGLTDKETAAADVNGDGAINAKDANTILRYAAAAGTGDPGDIKNYI
jgi:hypothetical protein